MKNFLKNYRRIIEVNYTDCLGKNDTENYDKLHKKIDKKDQKMTVQPDKCFEHHMMLKAELENFKKEFDDLTQSCRDMHCFFFGGINQSDGHISFVDKVNSLYEAQKNTRKFYNTFLSIFGGLIVTGLISLGIGIHTLSATSTTLAGVIENTQKIRQEQIEIRLEVAELKAKAVQNETY